MYSRDVLLKKSFFCITKDLYVPCHHKCQVAGFKLPLYMVSSKCYSYQLPLIWPIFVRELNAHHHRANPDPKNDIYCSATCKRSPSKCTRHPTRWEYTVHPYAQSNPTDGIRSTPMCTRHPIGCVYPVYPCAQALNQMTLLNPPMCTGNQPDALTQYTNVHKAPTKWGYTVHQCARVINQMTLLNLPMCTRQPTRW
jgi:hypothetical protein